MNNLPFSSPPVVPFINIYDADSPLPFEDLLYSNFTSADASFYTPECTPFGSSSNSPSALDDMSGLSQLPYLTGPTYAPSYSILQDNAAAVAANGRLTPSSLSSAPSPTTSSNSLSPLSFCEHSYLSDSDPNSPSPTTPDPGFWPQHQMPGPSQSNDSLVLRPLDDPFPPLAHRRTKSSPSARREPVASKAMLEANSRRRRHPAQFECPDCKQTFTALFSLKRHMQSHSGERPFTCSVPGCSQRFFNSSDCKRHEKSKKRHKELAMQRSV